MLREVEIRNSSPPLSKPHPPQNSGPTLSSASPTTSRHSSGRKAGPFCGMMEELTDNKWVLSLSETGSRSHSSPIGCSDKSVSSSSPLLREITELLRNGQWKVSSSPNSCSDKSSSSLLREEIGNFSRSGQWKGYGIREHPFFYSRLFLVPIKNGKLCPVIELSLLNLYINKQHFKMKTVKSVRQLIMANE